MIHLLTPLLVNQLVNFKNLVNTTFLIFYCVCSADVETTGSSNEFYDKFSIRYHISIIMKSLWEDVSHRQAIMKQSR